MVAFQQTEFAQILGMPGWRFQYGQKSETQPFLTTAPVDLADKLGTLDKPH